MPFPALKRDQNHTIVQDSYLEREFRGEYDGSNNLIYAGYAAMGSAEGDRVWQIQKMAYTGTNMTSIKWPEINSFPSTDYSFSWTDRATYVYS